MCVELASYTRLGFGGVVRCGNFAFEDAPNTGGVPLLMVPRVTHAPKEPAPGRSVEYRRLRVKHIALGHYALLKILESPPELPIVAV